MFAVKFQGRLGNNLFQWAFLLAAEKKMNSWGVWEGTNYLNQLLRLGYLRSLITRLNKRRVFINLPFQDHSITSKLYLSGAGLQDGVRYDGYFQSFSYFGEAVLKQIQNQVKISFRTRCSECVVMHFRQTDYKDFGGEALGGVDVTLPISFYLNALKVLSIDPQSTALFLVGDDKTYIENAKSSFFPNATVSSGRLTDDMKVMLNARVLIISNSTLAWWMGMLNFHKCFVVAPKYWLGFKVKREEPSGIEYSNPRWKWIEVYE